MFFLTLLTYRSQKPDKQAAHGGPWDLLALNGSLVFMYVIHEPVYET